MYRLIGVSLIGVATTLAVYNTPRRFSHVASSQERQHIQPCFDQATFRQQLVQRQLELDKIDKDLHLSDLKKTILSVFPLEADIVNTFTDEKVLTDLMYICVMYDKPLKPFKRVQLRETVSSIAKSHTLTTDQVAFLRKLLEHYEVIKPIKVAIDKYIIRIIFQRLM